MSISSSSRPLWVRISATILLAFLAGALDGAPEETSGREPGRTWGGAGEKAPAREPGAKWSSAPQAHEGGRRVARVAAISPRIGPPGTHVTLKVEGMPALTPVQLAIGATHTGFEALLLGLTTVDGDLQESVEVPAWARRDQTHRFIVFNLYFSAVLAESAIFHVTDTDGLVVREGEVRRAAPACLTLEGDDGERYHVIGATGELEVGARARLEGTLTESPQMCEEGLSLDLELR